MKSSGIIAASIVFSSELLFSGGTLQAAISLEDINNKVDKVERRIEKHDKTLPSIEVTYDYKDATEGVPPQFSFFFDIETGKLVACKIHVGFETWSRDVAYYFNENEEIEKYLEIVPQSKYGPSAHRSAIIYGKNGKVLWTNMNGGLPREPPDPRETPDTIKTLFHELRDALDKFSHY